MSEQIIKRQKCGKCGVKVHYSPQCWKKYCKLAKKKTKQSKTLTEYLKKRKKKYSIYVQSREIVRKYLDLVERIQVGAFEQNDVFKRLGYQKSFAFDIDFIQNLKKYLQAREFNFLYYKWSYWNNEQIYFNVHIRDDYRNIQLQYSGMCKYRTSTG